MKSYKYMIDNGIFCVARETRSRQGLAYDIWSSRTREWRPSETAAGVFAGFEDGIWKTITVEQAYSITKHEDQANASGVDSSVSHGTKAIAQRVNETDAFGRITKKHVVFVAESDVIYETNGKTMGSESLRKKNLENRFQETSDIE